MRTTRAFLVALLALSAGCGSDGGSSGILGGDPIVPDPVPTVGSQAYQVPRAAAAAGAIDLATQASTNLVLDEFTGGEASGAPKAFLSPADFSFSWSVQWEIDLDAQRPNGDDRFPNISGLLLVSVEGTLQGTWMAGDASFAVSVEAGSDIAAVDPDSGVETLIPQGSSWSYSLAVTWEFTDSQNWIVVATATTAVSIDGLVVTDGDQVTTISITGGREVITAIAKVDGEIVKERSVSGSFTITIDDGQNVVEVLIEFDADGLILVTIGDEQFGPFTPEEFRAFIQDNIRA